MSPSYDLLKSEHWPDDAPIHGLTPQWDEKLRRRYVFSDQEWVVSYRENTNTSSRSVNFGRLFKDPIQNMCAREFTMNLLAGLGRLRSSGKGRRQPTGHTVIISAMDHLRLLYGYMHKNNIASLKDLQQDDLNELMVHVKGRDVRYRRILRRNIIRLYLVRDRMTHDYLNFHPWNGQLGSEGGGTVSPTETKTLPIPTEVIAPLVRWSLYYIDHLAEDIISAVYLFRMGSKRHIENRSRFSGIRKIKTRQELADATLHQLDGKLPLFGGQAETSSWSRGSTAFRDRVLKQVGPGESRADIEVEETEWKLSCLPGTQIPWREHLWERDINAEYRNLIAACYVIIAYLSGMRDSEVQALRMNCLHSSEDASGNVIRHYLVSKQYKHRRVEGEERTWVVIEPVERAVEVMKRISVFQRTMKPSELLFLLPSALRDGNLSLGGNINRYISSFIDHINGVHVPRINSEAYPPIPIQTFRPIITKMFRRTIAWHIANQPFGVVAGMLQYGHLSAQMFEGYAGSPEAGLSKDIEHEKRLANRADVRGAFHDHLNGVKVAGPGAERITAEFDRIAEMASFSGKVVVDPRVLDDMLAHPATTLFPREINDCFFHREHAKCLPPMDRPGHATPMGRACQFDTCQNSCWRTKHLPVIEARLADLVRLSRKNAVRPGQKAILDYEIVRLQNMIVSIGEASRGAA